MTFATSKFRSFLPAATFAMAAEFLMGLSDSVICGHILGETGLSAVNLMQGVFEFVTFVSMMVTVGTSVLFATELGALHVRRAKGYFTLGMLSAVVFGLLFAVVLAYSPVVLGAFQYNFVRGVSLESVGTGRDWEGIVLELENDLHVVGLSAFG